MTFAQFVGNNSTGIIGAINFVVVPMILTIAFLYYVWGIVRYLIINASDETSRSEGRNFAFWGVLALALMFSVWGFVNLALSTFGLTQ